MIIVICLSLDCVGVKGERVIDVNVEEWSRILLRGEFTENSKN